MENLKNNLKYLIPVLILALVNFKIFLLPLQLSLTLGLYLSFLYYLAWFLTITVLPPLAILVLRGGKKGVKYLLAGIVFISLTFALKILTNS